jgi:hypothetical protein
VAKTIQRMHKALMILLYVWLYNENHMYESGNFSLFSLSLLGTENMQKHFFSFSFFFISLSGDVSPVRKGW